jgi:hypothetical protein
MCVIVNTASRLQATAEPGTLVVDEATRRTTEAAIAYVKRLYTDSMEPEVLVWDDNSNNRLLIIVAPGRATPSQHQDDLWEEYRRYR